MNLLVVMFFLKKRKTSKVAQCHLRRKWGEEPICGSDPIIEQATMF